MLTINWSNLLSTRQLWKCSVSFHRSYFTLLSFSPDYIEISPSFLTPARLDISRTDFNHDSLLRLLRGLFTNDKINDVALRLKVYLCFDSISLLFHLSFLLEDLFSNVQGLDINLKGATALSPNFSLASNLSRTFPILQYLSILSQLIVTFFPHLILTLSRPGSQRYWY